MLEANLMSLSERDSGTKSPMLPHAVLLMSSLRNWKGYIASRDDDLREFVRAAIESLDSINMLLGRKVMLLGRREEARTRLFHQFY